MDRSSGLIGKSKILEEMANRSQHQFPASGNWFLRRLMLIVALISGVLLALPVALNAQGTDLNPGNERYRPIVTWLNGEARRTWMDGRYLFYWHQFPAAETKFFDRLTGYSGFRDEYRSYQGVRIFSGPRDAYVYGFGKNGWSIAYDPKRQIVLFGNGCCAYGREVLTVTTMSPPAPGVPVRELRYVRTVRGVHLGMTLHDVRWLEGHGVERVDARTHTVVLGYYTQGKSETCVEERTFVFHGGKLVAIEIDEGC